MSANLKFTCKNLVHSNVYVQLGKLCMQMNQLFRKMSTNVLPPSMFIGYRILVFIAWFVSMSTSFSHVGMKQIPGWVLASTLWVQM